MSQIRQVALRRAPVFGNDLRTVLDTFFGSGIAAPGSSPASAWSPRVDVREEADRFLILADVPGVELDDIQIEMDKNVLSIQGQRKAYAAEGEARYARVERPAGAFARRFTLPDSADAERITAGVRHGVLEVAIPKRAELAPRRIAINAAG